MRSSPRRDYGIVKNDGSPHCKLRSVDLRSVRWTRGFWGDRFRQCRDITLPRFWDLLSDPEQGCAPGNLRIADGTHSQDGWICHWIEAAASVYAATGDRELDARMDAMVEVVARAQQADGYLAIHPLAGSWERLRDARPHALCGMGHLTTAACIHHRVTGKTNLLDVARRAGDLVHAALAERRSEPARLALNPTLVLAAVELFRTTGERRYLDMATACISGRSILSGAADDAVWAAYLYAGAADSYMETGDPSLLQALEQRWVELGGVGGDLAGGCPPIGYGPSPRRQGSEGCPANAGDAREATEPAHDPAGEATHDGACAQTGRLVWGWRMLAITGDAHYADTMERELYNSILSGVSLNGAGRFSPNPLPLIAQWHGYLYSTSEEGLWLHHYGAGTFEGVLPDGTPIRVRQETKYPWEGEVELTVEMPGPADFALMLRIPGWVEEAHLLVNDRARDMALEPGTYARIRRTWLPGDRVVLVLPMIPCLAKAPTHSEQPGGQVAVTRGPLIYCLESPDLPEGVRLSEVCLPERMRWSARHKPDLLGGVTVLDGEALRVPADSRGSQPCRPSQRAGTGRMRARLIPYYARSNRGPSEMAVWMPTAGAQR